MPANSRWDLIRGLKGLTAMIASKDVRSSGSFSGISICLFIYLFIYSFIHSFSIVVNPALINLVSGNVTLMSQITRTRKTRLVIH